VCTSSRSCRMRRRKVVCHSRGRSRVLRGHGCVWIRSAPVCWHGDSFCERACVECVRSDRASVRADEGDEARGTRGMPLHSYVRAYVCTCGMSERERESEVIDSVSRYMQSGESHSRVIARSGENQSRVIAREHVEQVPCPFAGLSWRTSPSSITAGSSGRREDQIKDC
jgi:hypothetical protein